MKKILLLLTLFLNCSLSFAISPANGVPVQLALSVTAQDVQSIVRQNMRNKIVVEMIEFTNKVLPDVSPQTRRILNSAIALAYKINFNGNEWTIQTEGNFNLSLSINDYDMPSLFISYPVWELSLSLIGKRQIDRAFTEISL